MISDAQMKRLEPFFVRAKARQRIVLALIANNHDIPELEGWTMQDLIEVELPPALASYRQQILDEYRGSDDPVSSPAFRYPNGKEFKLHDFHRIVRQATERVMGYATGPEEFREYVNQV